MLGAKEGSAMSELMRAWNVVGTPTNPPYDNRFLSKLTYLRQYIIDMAYVSPYATDETRKKFKRRIYETLLTLANNESTPSASCPVPIGNVYGKSYTLPWFLTP
jgi:hypothetical protein